MKKEREMDCHTLTCGAGDRETYTYLNYLFLVRNHYYMYLAHNAYMPKIGSK